MILKTFLSTYIYRYRDEVFITWNQSENQLRTLLATANSQFPQTMWLTTAIGEKIHFRDIELGQRHGVLRTSVYHELETEDDLLPPFLNVIPRPILDTSKWLRTALFKAIRYCSNAAAFNEEKYLIQSTLERNSFAKIIYTDGYEEFLNKFAIYMIYSPFNQDHYQMMRQQAFRYDSGRILKKTQSSIQQHQPAVLYLPYTPHWDTAAMVDFREELNNILKNNFGDHPRMKDFSIKILQRRCSPLPINDLLINKRPDKCYLTLSDMEKDKKGMY
jgi:hypothetical protein